MEDLILRTGVDNSKVAGGLAAFETMVSAKVASIQAKLGAVGNVPTGGLSSMGTKLGALESRFIRTTALSNQLSGSLNRMGSIFTGGMGIGLAIGGLAALEKAFERGITKARQFQTAQLAIAAQLASSYKITGGNSGKELTGPEAFQAAQTRASALNQQIIQRQARNILTYQEELNAFQSSLASGSRKGLSPDQILKVSEGAAIIAKTMGLAGEQLANAARQLTGGGINVSRTVIGRALGIQNQDIASRNGPELMKFLEGKMKGFQAAEPAFAKSIEGIMSTLEANLDIFFAKVGTKLFAKIQPAIEKLGTLLEGSGADHFADVLVGLFNAVFTAIQNIANSPAIPILIKFLEFLGNFGDKLLLIAAFSKLSGIVLGLASNVKGLAASFQEVAMKAAGAGTAMETAGTKGAVSAAKATLAKAGSRGLPLAAELSAAGFVPLTGQPEAMRAPGTGGKTNFPAYAKQFEQNMRRSVQADINDVAFAKFRGQMEYPINPLTAAEAEAANPLSRLKRTVGGMGVIGAQKLPGAAMGGLAGYGLSSFASSEMGLGGGASGALTAGGTTVGALAGAGSLFTPFGVGLAVVTTLLGGMAGALKEAQNEERRSTEALADLRAKYPIAGKLADLSEQANAIRNKDWLTPQQRDIRLKGIAEQRAGLRDIGTAQFGFYGAADPAKLQKEIQANIKQATGQLGALEGGYIDPKFKLAQESAIAQSKLHLAQASYDPATGTGGLAATDEQKKRAAAAFAQAERNRSIFHGAAPGQELSPEMAKDLTLGQAEQRVAFEDAQKSIKTKLQEEQKAADLKLRVARTKLTTSKKDVKADLDTQLMGLEAQMRSERGTLGVGMSNKVWEQFIATAKKTLADDFNEPLKDLESKLQAYDLAGIPKTTAGMVKLAIDAIKAKLKEAGEAAGLSAREIAGLQAYAEAKQQSEAVSARLGETGSILGATGRNGESVAAGLLGKAESSRYKYSPEAMQAAGFGSRDAMVAAERAKDLQDAQEAAKRKELDLQSAQIAAKQQQLAPTLASGGGLFGEVKSAIQMKVESQKGFDPAAYEQALRESQDLQEQEAEISRQRIKLDLAKAEKEYKESLATVTALQNGRLSGVVKGGLPGVVAGLPNPKAEGVQSAVASGTQSAPSTSDSGITVNLNGNVNVPGVSKAELAAMLSEKVPQIISEFCQNKTRTPR